MVKEQTFINMQMLTFNTVIIVVSHQQYCQRCIHLCHKKASPFLFLLRQYRDALHVRQKNFTLLCCKFIPGITWWILSESAKF